jgi:serine/threonine protein kinase
MIGQLLKGYQVVEKIKDGSVGTVWKVLNNRNQEFAIKQISEKNVRRSVKVRQFRREAGLTKRLVHPNIIRVYGYEDDVALPFFTMEYFPSENLKYAMWHMADRVHKYEFYILRQIAEALAYTHLQGIVHRDIKPENVLVNDESEVRLIDFSLAQTRLDRFLQFFRRVEGTPLYMSPEQIQGRRCDVRSDIYSFGVLTYELLTKRPPFLGTTEKALLEKHVKEPPPSMRTFVRTISPEIDAFCARMLSKKPEDRFPDMTSIIYELNRWERKDTVVRLRQVEPVRPRDETGRSPR